MTLNINHIIKEKRILAYLVDALLSLFVGFALILLNGIVNLIGAITNWFPFEYVHSIDQIIIILVTLGLSFFRDAIACRSFGKKLLGIKIVTINGNKPTRLQLIKKNLFSFLWFFEGFVLLTRGRTTGETISKTKIIIDEI